MYISEVAKTDIELVKTASAAVDGGILLFVVKWHSIFIYNVHTVHYTSQGI